MLNEHDREDGPEDGEYHFSDEGGYGPGPEEESKPPVLSETRSLAEKFTSYRRFVIVGAIAAAVFLVAYVAIPPLTTSAPTEIAAMNLTTTPAPAPAVSKAPILQKAPLPAAKPVVVEEGPKAAPAESPKLSKTVAHLISEEKEKLIEEKNKVMAHFTGEKQTQPLPVLKTPAPEQAATPPPGLTVTTSPVLSPLAQEFIAAPIGSYAAAQKASQTAQAAAANKEVLDKLSALEESNTRLIGQLQAEYAHKVADYEMQNKMLQEQVHTLNTRLASMEAEMSKLVQTVNKPPAASNEGMSNLSENKSLHGSSAVITAPPSVPSPQANYKSNYTVQAIIPGRAWLRTENGETITVAEGDVLKNLGKVSKIDPYDGIILIDTGSKVITLTYGNGEYA